MVMRSLTQLAVPWWVPRLMDTQPLCWRPISCQGNIRMHQLYVIQALHCIQDSFLKDIYSTHSSIYFLTKMAVDQPRIGKDFEQQWHHTGRIALERVALAVTSPVHTEVPQRKAQWCSIRSCGNLSRRFLIASQWFIIL
jgi:hypothetical protein